MIVLDQLSMADATTQATRNFSASEKEADIDVFERDWMIAKNYWKRKHMVWDYGYLNYKSVLTYNNIYGEDYLKAFGLQVFVPRTYQTVESIASQLNSRKTEFIIKGTSGKNGFKDAERAEYFQVMDNVEWRRSGAEAEKRKAAKNALIFGNGYLLNFFVDDTRNFHFIDLEEDEDGEPDSSQDGIKNSNDPPAPGEAKGDNWVPKEITKYKGMKPKSENPYYVFPDPFAKDGEDTYCYRYVVGTVDVLRDYVVQKGWMSVEDAAEKIKSEQVEKFDAIRDTIDTLFEQPITKWTRGDHLSSTNTVTSVNSTSSSPAEFSALIERYEPDFYEVRLADAKTSIYKDFNVYPHKEIPIITFKDNPVPDEPCGIGEPELIRWQQVEENKLHNLLMQAVMMAVVQRFAVNASLLEDETELAWHNPFKPIRLKPLPGVSVAQAIMPLAQPEVKSSPFELLKMVKEISQSTSGASDYVVSANSSLADTATESNNLMAAAAMRIKDKTKQMDEEATLKLIFQWHACYFYFYDEEMDFEITGEEAFIRWLPYDRSEANENAELIAAARKALNVAEGTGDTLEAVYQAKGYKQVVFISDVMEGSFTGEVKITDVEMDKSKTFDDFLKLIKVMNEVNVAAKDSNDPRRFDVFEVALEAMKYVTVAVDPKKYVKNGEAIKATGMIPTAPPTPAGSAVPPGANPTDPMAGMRQGQVTATARPPAAPSASPVAPVQAMNTGM